MQLLLNILYFEFFNIYDPKYTKKQFIIILIFFINYKKIYQFI